MVLLSLNVPILDNAILFKVQSENIGLVILETFVILPHKLVSGIGLVNLLWHGFIVFWFKNLKSIRDMRLNFVATLSKNRKVNSNASLKELDTPNEGLKMAAWIIKGKIKGGGFLFISEIGRISNCGKYFDHFPKTECATSGDLSVQTPQATYTGAP